MFEKRKEILVNKARITDMMRYAEKSHLARQHALQNNAQAEQKSVWQTVRSALKLRQA